MKIKGGHCEQDTSGATATLLNVLKFFKKPQKSIFHGKPRSQDILGPVCIPHLKKF